MTTSTYNGIASRGPESRCQRFCGVCVAVVLSVFVGIVLAGWAIVGGIMKMCGK